MSAIVASVVHALAGVGVHVSPAAVAAHAARAAGSAPPPAEVDWCKEWQGWRDAARRRLSDDAYAARFDPFWTSARPKMCGPFASRQSAGQAILGARVLIQHLQRSGASALGTPESAQGAPLPPYIPHQSGTDPPDVVNTPDREPSPNRPGLLPLLIAGAAVTAALIIATRRRT